MCNSCVVCPSQLLRLPSCRSAEALIKMKLHELMPEPYAQLHQRYIKGRGVCTLQACAVHHLAWQAEHVLCW